METTGGVRGGHSDTALTRGGGGGGTLEEDVALHTPASAPGVLNIPVVRATESAVADGEDTVVEGGAAGIGHDTAGVELPVHTRSINGHRHGLLSNGGGQSSFTVGSDVNEALDTDDGGAGGHGAGAVLGGVGVGRFSAESRGVDDILESLVHQTTVAALVAEGSGAVHELLFGEGDGSRVVLNGVVGLNGTGGREGPAGTALALILDGGDFASLDPVNGGGSGKL